MRRRRSSSVAKKYSRKSIHVVKRKQSSTVVGKFRRHTQNGLLNGLRITEIQLSSNTYDGNFRIPWSTCALPLTYLYYSMYYLLTLGTPLLAFYVLFIEPWHFGFKYRHITAAGFDDRYEEIRREYVDWCVVAYISIIFFICSFSYLCKYETWFRYRIKILINLRKCAMRKKDAQRKYLEGQDEEARRKFAQDRGFENEEDWKKCLGYEDEEAWRVYLQEKMYEDNEEVRRKYLQKQVFEDEEHEKELRKYLQEQGFDDEEARRKYVKERGCEDEEAWTKYLQERGFEDEEAWRKYLQEQRTTRTTRL